MEIPLLLHFRLMEMATQSAELLLFPKAESTHGPRPSNYGVNVNASDDNKIASLIFIKWMTEKSNWCYDEGGYTVDLDGQNPDMYSAFEGCELLSDVPALPGEESFLNDMNAESELSFNAGGNDKVQRIVEAAATGSESFDDIMADWTKAWNDAQEELEIEVLY